MYKKRLLLFAFFAITGTCAGFVYALNRASPPTRPAVKQQAVSPQIPSNAHVVFGALPSETTAANSANFALPEDAIETSSGVYAVADTHSGYIKEIKSNQVTVFADLNSPDKSPLVLALQPFKNGFLSFSADGSGITFHSPEGAKFLGDSYKLGSETLSGTWVKFAQEHEASIIALDAKDLRNNFLKVTDATIESVTGLPDLHGLDIMGFDFCGTSLIVSRNLPNGDVTFDKYDGAKKQHLFTDRAYSNSIHCLGNEDFLYGARWELKRYKSGDISSLASGFIHISSIRKALSDTDAFIITDSDAETITRWSLSGERTVIATSKGQLFSDPIVKMQVVGDDIFGMTPDATLVRMNIKSGNHEVLLSHDGSGLWDPILAGFKFESLRTFVYDQATNIIYFGSNHGIFSMDLSLKKFQLFAGLEGTYGSADGTREQARFAVVRDLLVDGERLYVADAWNDKIRLIDLNTGVVDTYAGSGRSETKRGNARCSPRLSYNFNRPLSLAMLEGKVVVANSYSHDLVIVDNKDACLLAGTPMPSSDQYGGGLADGAPNEAQFNGPQFLTSAHAGVLVSDSWNGALRFVDRNGNTSTIYQNPNSAKMVSAAAFFDGRYYFGSADSTVKMIAATAR